MTDVPSDAMATLGYLPIMYPHTVQQQTTHQARHARTDNPDLLVLFARYKGRRIVLALQICNTVEPGTVWVIERFQRLHVRGRGGGIGPLLDALRVDRDWGGGTDDAEVRECV